MTVAEVQAALGIGRSLAYKLITAGAIKHMRIGKRIKIPKAYLIAYVTNSCYNDIIATSNLPC